MASGTIHVNSPMPSWIYEEKSTSTSDAQTYSYTVSGNGYIIATLYIRSDTSNDYGTMLTRIDQIDGNNETFTRGWSSFRNTVATTEEIGTEATACFYVSNGDTISFIAKGTKSGTKRIRYSAFSFGCTLTAQ